MSKVALFFPGQGSQYVGMAKDLYDYSDQVKKLYEMASLELGEDIARISFEGPASELNKTKFTQPAILLHSLAVLTILGEEKVNGDFACGHSLGEYSALAASGAISFEDAIKAVCKRASLMEEACIKYPGTMAAIVGLEFSTIEDVCSKAQVSGMVVPANCNTKKQTVVSGEIVAVEKALKIAKEDGAKLVKPLDVGGAFHSPLMESAKAGMNEFLNGIRFENLSKPVIANVTAKPIENSSQIGELLVEQITSPVKWSQSMTYLMSENVSKVIEIGPRKVLGNLAKREMSPDEVISLDKLEDIQKFLDE